MCVMSYATMTAYVSKTMTEIKYYGDEVFCLRELHLHCDRQHTC